MTTEITAEQFDQLYSSGHPPFDVQKEEGRLGVAFNVEDKGIVKAWRLGGKGNRSHVLETPKSFAEARRILSL